jgi:hypothetical protein
MSDDVKPISDLGDADQFVVCHTLKALAKTDVFSENLIKQILSCTQSDTIAIERSALKLIISSGPKLEVIFEPLLKRASARIHDKGCDYSCCGFSAYHGPVDLYMQALVSIKSISSGAKIRPEIEKITSSNEDVAEICFLIDELGD